MLSGNTAVRPLLLFHSAQSHLSKCIKYFSDEDAIVLKRPIDSYLTKMTSSQNDLLQLQAARAIFTTGRLFMLFDHFAFAKFFTSLNPGLKAPSPKRISNELLLAVYVEYKGRVQALIEAANYINIVLDASENIQGERVLNLYVGSSLRPGLLLEDS
jgi:hypothetical protein